MKSVLVSMLLAAITTVSASSSFACTITPQGDSRLRVIALNDSLDPMESLNGFSTADQELYKVEVHSFRTGQEELRLYKLENISAMCPVYKVTRMK